MVTYNLELFGNRHIHTSLTSISVCEDGSFNWYKTQSPITKCKARYVIEDKFQLVTHVRNAVTFFACMKTASG